MFEVTKNSAYTAYKYGVNVDWSEDNAFPTTGLNNGDSFSLVSADSLSFAIIQNAVFSTPSSFFPTDAANDSAIYSVNGTEFCQELFPLNYTINGSPQTYNTTRVYVPTQNYVQSTDPSLDRNSSTMFVCFDGFYYNQSTEFSFDPTVINYNPASSTGSPSPTNNPSQTPSANNSSPSPTPSTTGSQSTPTSSTSPTTTTGTPEPSPTIAEFPSLLVILTIFMAVTLSIAVLVTSRKSKIIQAQNAKT
jgi:cell division septation protein DedD